MRLKQKLALYTLAGSIFFTVFSFFMSVPTVSAAFHDKESDCTNARGVWYRGKCWFDKSVGKPKCNSVNGNWHETLVESAPLPVQLGLSEPTVGYCVVEESPDDPPDIDECLGNIDAVTGECEEYRECERYSNPSEKRACVQGYRVGQSACENLTGSKKEACLHGARNGDNPPVSPTDQCPDTNVIHAGCSGGSNNPIWNILLLVINILAAGIGLVAIGGVVYGAILYATAQNNSSQVTKAKTTITNTIFGLVAFALMYSFLQYLIPGGFINNLTNPPNIPAPSAPSNPPPDDNNGGGNNDDDEVALSDINLRNLRDAAGTTNGNVLRSGVLYRSSELHNLRGANQPKKLGQLLGRNAIIIDVRPENSPPDKAIPGVRRINIPIVGWTDEVDVAVTDPARRRGLGRVLRTMANADGPVLLHCIAGKDRTGWLVAMIMHVNGANSSQIMTEYLKSNASGYTVKREWLNTGLSAARREPYGSLNNYLKQGLGLNDSDLRKLRQKFGA